LSGQGTSDGCKTSLTVGEKYQHLEKNHLIYRRMYFLGGITGVKDQIKQTDREIDFNNIIELWNRGT
jgi:hypothetical protein